MSPAAPVPVAPAPFTGRGLPPGPVTGSRSTRRGVQLVLTRGATSKKRLRVDWQYPVPELGEQPLSREAAFERIRVDDRRPLLVLRECASCVGTDDALLRRKLNNEKTLILTRWFRCVKLPNHVLEANHPFHLLFDGDRPPHLFLLSTDNDVVPFDGRQSQKNLWQAMNKMLRTDYERRPERAVKGLLRVLDRFDYLDSQEVILEGQLDAAMLAGGPSSSRTRRIVAKLNDLQAERKRTLAVEEKLAELELK